jgi:hypothetical protein
MHRVDLLSTDSDTLSSCFGPNGATAADLNGDADDLLDLIVTNNRSSDVGVLIATQCAPLRQARPSQRITASGITAAVGVRITQSIEVGAGLLSSSCSTAAAASTSASSSAGSSAALLTPQITYSTVTGSQWDAVALALVASCCEL